MGRAGVLAQQLRNTVFGPSLNNLRLTIVAASVAGFVLLGCAGSPETIEPAALDQTEARPSGVVESTDVDSTTLSDHSDLPSAEDDTNDQAERDAVDREGVDQNPLGSPLDQLFGGATSKDEFESELASALASRAAGMTICMREAGFDFFVEPVENRDGHAAFSSQAGILSQDGYGVARTASNLLALATSGAPQEAIYQDRLAALEALSSEEQEAYRLRHDECQSAAYEEFPDPGIGTSIPAEVQREIEVARIAIEQDPGFERIWQPWAECMREAGYEFSDRDEAVQSLWAGLSQFNAQVQGDGLGEDQVREMQMLVDDIERNETEIVRADLKCTDDHGTDIARRELRYELELEVVRLNGDRWTLMLNAE